MRALLLVTLVFLIPARLTAQPKIEKYFFDASWKVVDSTVAHYVIYFTYNDSINGSGSIKRTTINGNPVSETHFSNMQEKIRDGISEEYDETGRIKLKSTYQNGKLNGEQTKYYHSGGIRKKEIYENDKITSKRCYTLSGKDTACVENESLPQYPGGQSALLKFISDNVKYPEKAYNEKITGTVIVQFIIDEHGKIIKTKVAKPIHPLLDEEALRVINLMPTWTPAMKDEQPVPVQFSL